MNQYPLLAAVLVRLVRYPWRSRHSSQFRFVIWFYLLSSHTIAMESKISRV